MTYEEYLRNRLDRLNQNSHYGIMIDTEITDIVRNHIKRLEEMKMKATSTEEFKDIIAIDFELQTFPNPDVQDKFIVSATNRDDIFAFVFEGPNLRDACRKTGLFTGWEKDQKIRELEEELKISKDQAHRLDKENDWLRKNYMTVAKDEEIKEKNRKINDLYHQLHRVKRDADRYKYLKTMNEEYSEQINALQRMYNLEKAANEAQHKFFVNYAGRGTEIEFNYAIGDTDEVTYVIVDKKTYDEKPNINLHGKDFTQDELVDRVLELEKKNLDLQKAYDILDKALDESQKACNKWYEKWVKMQSEQDCHKKEHEEARNNVNHPSHYTGKYECIDVMQDVFGDEATDNFCLCNAFKYIWRARKKNGLEDVKKAVWYLNKYIEEAEKDGVPKGK